MLNRATKIGDPAQVCCGTLPCGEQQPATWNGVEFAAPRSLGDREMMTRDCHGRRAIATERWRTPPAGKLEILISCSGADEAFADALRRGAEDKATVSRSTPACRSCVTKGAAGCAGDDEMAYLLWPVGLPKSQGAEVCLDAVKP
jgi:hypothetical protein